jgi:hypothetical protein
MKKNLGTLCAMFFFCVSISCSSSDGNSKTQVIYKVLTESSMTTSIMYRKADGTMTEGLTENILEWEKTVNVDKPFTASLNVTFNNTNPNTENYWLSIYVDGDLKSYIPGVVPASATTTGTATFEIPE